MGQKKLLEQLKQAELFSKLRSDDLAALAPLARSREAKVVELLFSAGDRATGFYVLLEGKIKL